MLKIIPKTLRALSFLMLFFLFTSNSTLAADFYEQNITLKKQGDVLLSPVIIKNQPVNSISVSTNESLMDLRIDLGKGWESVELHNDYGQGWEGLIVTSPVKQFQFKATASNLNQAGLNIRAEYIEDLAWGGPEYSYLEASNGVVDVGLPIISRTQWGANEELRVWDPDKQTSGSGESVNPCAEIEEKYGGQFKTTSVVKYNEQGEELTWPLVYADGIKKFSVHHSDSEIRDMNGDGLIDSQDYQAMVRAIYSFHTVSRGWGDVGYNYLIDPLGNIYEGRYGGDKVVGAHSLCFNHSVIGIAIIGNYEGGKISTPAFKALTQLIGKKAKQYGIDPLAASEFNGKYLDNIFGHKDVRATSCPGTMLYSQLSEIREEAARVYQNSTQAQTGFDFNAELISTSEIGVLDEGERKKVVLTFKNTGKIAWDESTWLYVNNNTNPYARIVPIVQDKNFVGADLKETSVAPGKNGTFEILIEGNKNGEYSFQVSPVVNGKYKISRAATFVKYTVEDSKYDYEVVSVKLPYGYQFQGEHVVGSVKLKNTGELPWKNEGINAVRLGAWEPKDRLSDFVYGNKTRMGYLIEDEVKPGEIGEFKLDLHIPKDRTGMVIEHFVPVVENVKWLKDKGLVFKVNILKPGPLASTKRITPVSDLEPGEKRYVEFEIKNKGVVNWSPSNFTVSASGKDVWVEKNLMGINKIVQPGESVKVGFWIKLGEKNGVYRFYVRPKFNGIPIHEGLGGFFKNVFPITLDKPVTPKPVDVPTQEPEKVKQPFRVKISHASSSATLTANTEFLVTNGEGQALFNKAIGTEVTVTKNGAEFEIKSGSQVKKSTLVRLVPKETTGVTEIKTMERRPAWNESLNDNRFRGIMEMRIIDDKVVYINELPLEDYVKGLAEVSNNSPTEKQKVIAVLARTYARFYMDSANRKFPGMPYDGSDDPDVFQKYLGYGVEMRSPNFVKAAEATRDMVVTYKGNLIKTPYFNQSDGKTRSAQEVWGWTNTPYLISVPDPWSEGLTLSGHGVGLSGHGATKQAEEGKKFDEIIKYYYTGVDVEKMTFN